MKCMHSEEHRGQLALATDADDHRAPCAVTSEACEDPFSPGTSSSQKAHRHGVFLLARDCGGEGDPPRLPRHGARSCMSMCVVREGELAVACFRVHALQLPQAEWTVSRPRVAGGCSGCGVAGTANHRHNASGGITSARSPHAYAPRAHRAAAATTKAAAAPSAHMVPRALAPQPAHATPRGPRAHTRPTS